MVDRAAMESSLRRTATIDLLVLVSAAIMLTVLIGPGRAVFGGSLVVKIVFLGRMGVFLLIATWLLHRQHRTWRDVGLRSLPWWRLIAAVPIGLIAISMAVATAKMLLIRAGYPVADYSAFRPLRGNLAEYLFRLLPVTLGSAAFGEEMIFRGFMLDAFERLLGGERLATILAILLQATAFSLFHAYQGVGGMVTTAIVGFLLGVIWWAARRNLWPGVIIHAILDGSAMTAIFLGMPVN